MIYTLALCVVAVSGATRAAAQTSNSLVSGLNIQWNGTAWA
jgi:hypothetical protein